MVATTVAATSNRLSSVLCGRIAIVLSEQLRELYARMHRNLTEQGAEQLYSIIATKAEFQALIKAAEALEKK